jgi:hypothetical protein
VELRTEVIQVIIWATGTISKLFTKYLSNISEKHDNKVLQKAAILGTGCILQKVLM